MKLIKGIASGIAAGAMLLAPLAAAAAPATANPAASLSLQGARAGTATAHNSKLGASVGTTTLINIGILAALVAVVLVATSGGDSSDSN